MSIKIQLAATCERCGDRVEYDGEVTHEGVPDQQLLDSGDICHGHAMPRGWTMSSERGLLCARCRPPCTSGGADALRITATDAVLCDVAVERDCQRRRWGEQNLPDGTGDTAARLSADAAKDMCSRAMKAGTVTWRNVLAEEVAEAFAEADPAKLRAELVQAAAVAVQWIECIDRGGERLPYAGDLLKEKTP